VHLVACLVFCSGLSGIAVGLGAKMPNLRDDSPSRIAAGFGGTLNLVISTAYIAAVVAMTAIPCHLYLAAVEGVRVTSYSVAALERLLILGTAGCLVLGVITTWLPLKIGCRAFRDLEF
jgi:ABC-2 type transport system permease protein